MNIRLDRAILVSLVVGIVLMFLLAAISRTQAQDATPTQEEPTAVPTEVVEPVEETPAPVEDTAPIVEDQVNFRLGILGAIFGVVMLLVSGMGIGYVWGHIRASKEAKDNLELAFNSTSPETQEQIRRVYETTQTAWDRVDALAREVLKFVGEVTDKAPNVDDPIVTQKIQAEVTKQLAQRYNPPS